MLFIIISLFFHDISCGVINNAIEVNKLSLSYDSPYIRDVMRRAKSAEIRNYMNEKIDPCHDFYQFACGNWANLNSAELSGKITTGVFELLNDSLNSKVLQLLQSEQSDVNETPADKKVKDFYKSCTKMPMLNYNYKLEHIVKEFGKMPILSGDDWNENDFDWLETIAKINAKYGHEILIMGEVIPDIKDNKINRVYIMEPELSLKTKSVYVDASHEEYRKKYAEGIAAKLKFFLRIEDQLATTTAAEIVDFEVQLAKGLVDEKLGLGFAELAHATTVAQLQHKYAPVIDIEKYLQIAFNETIAGRIYEYNADYQRNLMSVIPKTPQRIMANYIFYVLLDKFFFLSKKNVEVHQEDCMKKTAEYFSRNIDNMFYRKYKLNRAETDIHNMWKELKETFKKQLLSQKYDWIQAPVRHYAVEKLEYMKLEINSYAKYNFTEEFDSLIIDDNNYVLNIANILELKNRRRVALLHKPEQGIDFGHQLSTTPVNIVIENAIKIPVAILQPNYLWANSYPNAIKFGNLGALIGHELIHGFDDTGRKFDRVGNDFEWWDNSSASSFRERTDCFVEQYSKYSYGGHLLPRSQLQAENIADNGGLRLSYAAYLKWNEEAVRSGADLSYEIFPDMNYTSRQLFFISFAQIWCSDMKDSLKSLLTAVDTHTPAELRVIGVLSNFDQFATEFQCPEGTHMNPKDKCVIY